MDTKACGFRKQGCSSMPTGQNSGHVVIWIVAVDTDSVHVFLQRPGQPIEALSMGCCCSKEESSPGELAKYLDTALVRGRYTGLVVVGSEVALRSIKALLSPPVHNRVIAEIIEDIAGKNAHEVAQSIAARMT